MLIDKILNRENSNKADKEVSNIDEASCESAELYEEESMYNDTYEDNNVYEDDIYEDEANIEDTDSFNTNEDIYSHEQEDAEEAIDEKHLRKTLDSISRSGHSIVVTGCSGAGVSTVAYNTANTLSRLGYRTLIVDLDTEQKAQGYISTQAYESVDKDSADIERAINDLESVASVASLVKKNLYIITIGVAADAERFEDTINKNNIAEFMGMAKATFDFVVYDVPISNIIQGSNTLAIMCDTIIEVIDCSTWGIMKAIGVLFNIEDRMLLNVMFNKPKIVFNRVSNKNTLLGKVFKPEKKEWAKDVDGIAYQLMGEDIGVRFGDLGKASILRKNDNMDSYWYTRKAYSDTKDGVKEFVDILKETLVR